MQSPFSALSHRNFRLFWTGQCVSLIGTWMQSIAQNWLVLQLTGSAFRLGLVSAAQFLPLLLFSLYGGVIADRYPKRNILLLTQSLLLCQAVVLAALTWTGVVRYEHVMALAFGLGMINSLDMPTRQAYVMELAGREDLMNAVALNSAAFNAARLVGPALAGLIMGRFSTAACFSVNACSFLAVLAGLFAIPPGGKAECGPDRGVWRGIADGARYISRTAQIAEPLLLLGWLSVFAMNFGVLIPSFARFTLHGGPGVYGLLMSAMGAGAMIGALTLAALSRCGPKRWILALAGFGLCVTQIALLRLCVFPLAAAVLFFTGFAMVFFNASTNSTLQIEAGAEYRGRVMSVYSLFLGGLTPIGSLFAGAVTQRTNPAVALAVGGTVGLAGLLVMGLRWLRTARPQYEEGLTPP